MQIERQLNYLTWAFARAICFTLLIALTGCQTLAERKQNTRLENVLKTYEGVIRWGAIDQIGRYYRPESVGTMLRMPEHELRVTHYEVVQGPSSIGKDKVLQTALIQYVFESNQVVKELMDQQIWVYDAQTRIWSLQSPLPEFK